MSNFVLRYCLREMKTVGFLSNSRFSLVFLRFVRMVLFLVNLGSKMSLGGLGGFLVEI